MGYKVVFNVLADGQPALGETPSEQIETRWQAVQRLLVAYGIEAAWALKAPEPGKWHYFVPRYGSGVRVYRG